MPKEDGINATVTRSDISQELGHSPFAGFSIKEESVVKHDLPVAQ